MRKLALVAVVAAPALAHADLGDTALAFSYVVPVGIGAIATAVNGAYLPSYFTAVSGSSLFRRVKDCCAFLHAVPAVILSIRSET